MKRSAKPLGVKPKTRWYMSWNFLLLCCPSFCGARLVMTTSTCGLVTMDSVRYALIKASGTGAVATALLQIHLVDEAKRNSLVWFARVPTEANISDYPSRLVPHPFLDNSHCCNSLALERFNSMMEQVVLGKLRFGWGYQDLESPSKRVLCSFSAFSCLNGAWRCSSFMIE